MASIKKGHVMLISLISCLALVALYNEYHIFGICLLAISAGSAYHLLLKQKPTFDEKVIAETD